MRAQSSPTVTAALAMIGLVATLGCASSRTPPAMLDSAHENCSNCRMQVSSRQFASQLVGPGEEPRFFDDLECLSEYLKSHAAAPGGVVYVADHRTGEWARAATAVFTRVPSIETPMGSHIVAHGSAASRDQDQAVAGAEPIERSTLFNGDVPDGPRK
jgi:copper chaperone NosL